MTLREKLKEMIKLAYGAKIMPRSPAKQSKRIMSGKPATAGQRPGGVKQGVVAGTGN